VGDLTVCADVLMDYLNNNPRVPWDDLRYIFGEIMYGGHITDSWCRRINNTYLKVYLKPEILQQCELAPGFKVPTVGGMDFEAINDYILSDLPQESPPMFGLHPNAEIGYLTSFGSSIFESIVYLGGASASSGGGAGGDDAVRRCLNDLLSRLPENFSLIDLEERASPLLGDQTAPYVLVAMQECERMNALLSEIRRTLIELQKGLDGQLNITEAMEDLSQALSINQVPGRNPFHKTSWEALAWPSRKSLMTWFQDLLQRYTQLETWSSSLVTPLSLWLPGLFNPMAFLTAIMQVVARRTSLPLDNMAIETHITNIVDYQDVTDYPDAGLLVHGLMMEGARWRYLEESQLVDPYKEGVLDCAGYIADSRLKELLQVLPVIYLKAVEVQPHWEPSSVGYLRKDPKIYEAPIYNTTFRGPTYITLATLRTLDPVEKWILAGVSLILQSDD
jgi:dynein heavy chain